MFPVRLVLDTNLIVSAALKPEGLQRTALLLAITKPARMYVSRAVLSEYRTVLARPEFRLSKGQRNQLLQLIDNRAHLISPAISLNVASDPKDNIFLECADAGRADFLVTGNQRHFPKLWKSTKIINSREFIDLVSLHLIP